jgi:hypothetical protein
VTCINLILAEDKKYVVISFDEIFAYLCETTTHEIKKVSKESALCNGWEVAA